MKKKKKGILLKTAERKIKAYEKMPEYYGCYFYINKYDDGSYYITYSNPGEGLPW